MMMIMRGSEIGSKRELKGVRGMGGRDDDDVRGSERGSRGVKGGSGSGNTCALARIFCTAVQTQVQANTMHCNGFLWLACPMPCGRESIMWTPPLSNTLFYKKALSTSYVIVHSGQMPKKCNVIPCKQPSQ